MYEAEAYVIMICPMNGFRSVLGHQCAASATIVRQTPPPHSSPKGWAKYTCAWHIASTRLPAEGIQRGYSRYVRSKLLTNLRFKNHIADPALTSHYCNHKSIGTSAALWHRGHREHHRLAHVNYEKSILRVHHGAEEGVGHREKHLSNGGEKFG